MLAAAVETEVQPQHLGIAALQRVERLFDLVGQEAIHRLIFRVRQIVGDEPLDQRAVPVGIERRVEPYVARVERGQRLHDFERQLRRIGDFFRRRLAAQGLPQVLRRPHDARQIGGPVQRHAHRAALPRERGENRLADPPHGVRDELDALIGIELARRREQPDVALADDIGERQSAVLVFLGDRNHEAQVALHELLHRLLIAGADLPGERDLLLLRQQRSLRDLVQVLIEDVALVLDILDQYLHEVSKTPLLTQKEEIALARKVRAGDQEAMQELVKRNLRFVISVAKKYQNRGLPLTDIIGEGNVGLLTAARKFDPDQGVKFISYAVWWIRQAILAALARQGRTVRVPLNRTADLSRIVRTAEYLRQTLRREPTPEEIADATKLSLEVVQSLAALNTGDVRLDAPLDPDGDRSLIERFIAEDLPDTEDQAMDRFLSDEIEQALNTLQRRDAKVLRLYFGLDGGREHTLEEIGGMLGVTRERVRQLRDRALKRLRDGDVGKALASFAA